MKSRKERFAWYTYDWANSAFATTVMAGFFPVFFKMYWSHGANVNESTALLGFGNSAASLLVAITAPLMGSIADRSSGKKKFLIARRFSEDPWKSENRELMKAPGCSV